ncbi:MAG: hypothetical protein AAF542_06450 [Pseudomonadota bacterium]
MKILVAILVILASLLTGYLYGLHVGKQQTATIDAAKAALASMGMIESLRFHPETDPIDLYEQRINQSLVRYGEYLEKRLIVDPLYPGTNDVIEQMFSGVIAYRKEHPRIVNGVEYAPLKEDFENSKGFKSMEPEHKDRYLRKRDRFDKAMSSR